MVDRNSHSDNLNQHMMGDYSHVGDESTQEAEDEVINMEDLSYHLHGADRLGDTDRPSENDITDQQLMDDFPYVDNVIQTVRGYTHYDDEINRFLRPFGSKPPQEEDSFSVIMRQWNDEREAQERQKINSANMNQEVNDTRKTIGTYHNVPGDFAETLIFFDPFTFNSIVDEYMETILSNVDNRSVDDWLEILKRFNVYHNDDNLIPRSHRMFLKRLEDGPFDYMTQSDWELLVKVEAFMYYEWSVYPDVRAVTVPVNEENDEDYETFRVYLIGISWAVASCFLETMFYPRTNTNTFDVSVFQMLIAITGQIWAFLPKLSIPLSKGRNLVINNGLPWSFREQMLATVTMSVSFGHPYAQGDIIALSNKNFSNIKNADNFGFIFLLILSTEFMGFAIAGLQRAFFIYPSKMVYFNILNANSLSRALVSREPREKVNGWILKRWEFFYLFATIWFGWYWVLNILFAVLSDFEWPTWISPRDVDLNAITGTQSGLGIVPISTFDPKIISFTALYTPWNALWQYAAGFLITTIAAIIVWYSNTAYTGYLPINVAVRYDNTGNYYNISRILNTDNTLNLKAYENYSMVFYGATSLISMGVSYMYYPAQLLSCALNYWPDFMNSCKAFKLVFYYKKDANVLNGFGDRFSRSARSHPETPEWWFIVMFCCCFAVAIAVVEHWGFVKTPVYSILVSCGISMIFIYPMELLRARTTCIFDVHSLLLLINGMIFEGNPIGLMTSTLYGTALSSQNNNYIDNLKMGHYAGIAPRSLFRGQAISLLICSTVQAGLVQWQVSGEFKSNFCEPNSHASGYFTCQTTRSDFKDALFIAAASAKRVFFDYPYLKWAFLVGALYPLPLWIIRKSIFLMKPKSFLKKIINSDILVVLDEMVWLNAGLSWIPLNNWQFVGSNFIVGALWHKWIKPRYPQWFAKYTYLFYNTTLVSNSFGMLFNTIAQNRLESLNLSWWGNNANLDTLDNEYTGARLQIPKKGYFGPDKGEFTGEL